MRTLFRDLENIQTLDEKKKMLRAENALNAVQWEVCRRYLCFLSSFLRFSLHPILSLSLSWCAVHALWLSLFLDMSLSLARCRSVSLHFRCSRPPFPPLSFLSLS